MSLRPLLSALARWIMPGGEPSPEFHLYMKAMEDEIKALRESVDDHETRITALEP